MKKLIITISILLLIIICLVVFYDKHYQKLETEGVISNVNYKIYDDFKQGNYDYSKKGYYIDSFNTPNSPYFYIITMGEKNTGGYSIFITDLKIDNEKNVEVIVKEVKPKLYENATMAFTYPACCLELNTYANNITIKNTNGEIFRKLN